MSMFIVVVVIVTIVIDILVILVFIVCRDSDKTSQRTADVMRNVAELELIQAPTLSFIPPKSYSNLPQLKGVLQHLLCQHQ